MNFLFHLQEFLNFEIPQALLCCERELNSKFLHDLYHGQANNKKQYIKKMSLLTLNGGLWGDFIVVCWILHYLQCPIYVWNKNNSRIIVKIQDKSSGNTLHIV